LGIGPFLRTALSSLPTLLSLAERCVLNFGLLPELISVLVLVRASDLLVNDLLERDLVERDLVETERMLVDARGAENDMPPRRASAGVVSKAATARRAATEVDAMVRAFIWFAPVFHPM
jgi:hypothetical protein